MVLAATLVLGGVTVCPRGALSCPTRRQASHRCCAHTESLQAANCCADAACAPSAAVSAPAAGYEPDTSAKPVLAYAVSAATLPGGWQIRASHIRFVRAGPSPPRTPITQHTSLLL